MSDFMCTQHGYIGPLPCALCAAQWVTPIAAVQSLGELDQLRAENAALQKEVEALQDICRHNTDANADMLNRLMASEKDRDAWKAVAEELGAALKRRFVLTRTGEADHPCGCLRSRGTGHSIGCHEAREALAKLDALRGGGTG